MVNLSLYVKSTDFTGMTEHEDDSVLRHLSVCLWVLEDSLTWSKSCFPVVLGRMANSSSASMVVTRTFSCRSKHWTWTHVPGHRIGTLPKLITNTQSAWSWAQTKHPDKTWIFGFIGGKRPINTHVSYIFLFNHLDHPITRGWRGLQSKHEATGKVIR